MGGMADMTGHGFSWHGAWYRPPVVVTVILEQAIIENSCAMQ
jgi:hypothetical protein